jgi:sugar/nucleoside kinase (ribokinase family)
VEIDIVGIGTPVVDYFIQSSESELKELGLVKGASNYLPPKKLDALVSAMKKKTVLVKAGDNSRNLLEGAARLGCRTAFIGLIGNDQQGKIFETSVRKAGAIPFLQKRQGRTGKALVFLTRDSQRTFAVDLGITPQLSDFPEAAVKDGRILYITSIDLCCSKAIGRATERAIAIARKNRTSVALSLESPPLVADNRKRLLGIARRCSIIFANEDEVCALFNKPLAQSEKLAAKLSPLVFIKQGGRGSVLFAKGARMHIPPVRVKKVKDTTGAGDFYAAGVLAGLCRGLVPEHAALKGSWLASKAVSVFGARLPEKL